MLEVIPLEHITNFETSVCGVYYTQIPHLKIVFLSDCMEMVEKNYKFYLSFENSFCTDYITEKFWKILNYKVSIV